MFRYKNKYWSPSHQITNSFKEYISKSMLVIYEMEFRQYGISNMYTFN